MTQGTVAEKSPATPREHQGAIRRRLNLLREQHGQSEIARRVGVPLTTVHRLMRTGKIPGEMLAVLTQTLALNPAWVLLGQEPRLLADMPGAGAQMAGDLLALIDSMQAVSRMRLGALGGKPHQKVLRELLDALQAHESLRARINVHSRQALERLLNELEQCLNATNYSRAQAVRAAAEQVSRLCDDDDLALRFDVLRADMDYMTARLDSALEFERRSFSRQVLRGAFTSPTVCDRALMLVLLLKDSARMKEARRVGRAAMALASDHGGQWQEFQRLKLFVGHVEVELGSLHQGYAMITEAYPLIGAGDITGVVMMMRSQLLSGMMSLKDALEFGTPSSGRSRGLLRFASMMEDALALEALCGRCIGPDFATQVPPADFEGGRARIVLAALKGKGASAAREFAHHALHRPPPLPVKPVRDYILDVSSAQMAWLTGRREECEKRLLSAWNLLLNLPSEVDMTIDWQALMYRTAMRLDRRRSSPALQVIVAAGRRFLDEHRRLGYRCLDAFDQ